MAKKKSTYEELVRRIEELEKEKDQIKKKYKTLCIFLKKSDQLNYQDSVAISERNTSSNQTKYTPFISMCSACKKVRDSNNDWQSIDKYLLKILNQDISHGLCPECAPALYPEIFHNSRVSNPILS